MGLRIVRVANFVTPTSGGLRTALRLLGAGFLDAGHEPVLIVPGPEEVDEETEQGRVITLPGPVVPGTGGYRVLRDRSRVADTLARLRPDRLEVSDRTTLRWTGGWAREHGVPSAMVSHESLDGVLRVWGLPGPVARRAADRLNRHSARTHTRIICTTDWAAAEFRRIGAPNLSLAPLGVDLTLRHPSCHDPELRARWARPEEILLVMCSRLSPEKRPERALDALVELRRRGVPAVLVVAGDGPLRARMAARISREALPAHLLGHVASAEQVSAVLATADLALAPGPVETFGLAALEALACGTPVVPSARSALPAIVGPAGIAAGDSGEAFADAVQQLLARPAVDRRAAARARAERFGWAAAVDAFLAAHDVPPERAASPLAMGGPQPEPLPVPVAPSPWSAAPRCRHLGTASAGRADPRHPLQPSQPLQPPLPPEGASR